LKQSSNINDQSKFCGLHDWQISRFGAFQYFIHKNPRAADHLWQTMPAASTLICRRAL
jgi:hypothetical protein